MESKFCASGDPFGRLRAKNTPQDDSTSENLLVYRVGGVLIAARNEKAARQKAAFSFKGE